MRRHRRPNLRTSNCFWRSIRAGRRHRRVWSISTRPQGIVYWAGAAHRPAIRLAWALPKQSGQSAMRFRKRAARLDIRKAEWLASCCRLPARPTTRWVSSLCAGPGKPIRRIKLRLFPMCYLSLRPVRRTVAESRLLPARVPSRLAAPRMAGPNAAAVGDIC